MKQLSDEQLVKTIKCGKPNTAMPAWQGKLTDSQVADLVTYVRSLTGSCQMGSGSSSR